MDPPAYRGVVCHGVLAAVEAEPRLATRVLAAVDPSHIEAIRRATKLSWVPLASLDAINRAHLEHAGREAYLDFWRRYTVGAVEDSFFGALFASAVRIFGQHPAGLLRWLGRAWEISTRGLGRIVHDDADGDARICVVDLPPAGRQATVALSTQASVVAIIELTDHISEVELDVRSLVSDGRFEVTARWFPGVSARSG